MANRKALGRSFSSMLEDNLIETPKGAVQNLPLSDIEPNRGQPRHDFDEAALAALAASISQFGVLQPIIVTELAALLRANAVGARRELRGSVRYPR